MVYLPGLNLAPTYAELDGQPDASALGDDTNNIDDEDGVTFLTPLLPGSAADVEVVATASGNLNAWVDFYRDGDWADTDEHIFIDEPLVGGSNVRSFTVPATASPSIGTFSRFRFSTAGGLSFDGPAPDGEVEDHAVAIAAAATCVPEGPHVITESLTLAPLNTSYDADDPPRRCGCLHHHCGLH